MSVDLPRAYRIAVLCLQEFPNTPDVIRDSGRHSRGYAKGFVDAAEVVEREPHRNSESGGASVVISWRPALARPPPGGTRN